MYYGTKCIGADDMVEVDVVDGVCIYEIVSRMRAFQSTVIIGITTIETTLVLSFLLSFVPLEGCFIVALVIEDYHTASYLLSNRACDDTKKIF